VIITTGNQFAKKPDAVIFAENRSVKGYRQAKAVKPASFRVQKQSSADKKQMTAAKKQPSITKNR
jgi:hypothetical protein